METKRLIRPRNNRQLAGVCAGLGEYFNIDPVLVRVAFIITALAGGPGIVAYILLALVMPEEGAEKSKHVQI
jgi:phage shock protein C